MKKVAVVVLNFEVEDLVRKCIASIKKSTHTLLKIIIVDNSKNSRLRNLKSDGSVSLIEAGKNLGYTGGNNIGIRYALEKGADFIFILNPDTTVDKHTVAVLVEKAIQYSTWILSPKIYFAGTNIIWYAGGVFDFANVLGKHTGVDDVDEGQYGEDKEVDFATGAAMFVYSKVFKEVGLFDERYFLYYEDSDLCFRAKKAGFKIMYIADALVYHENAQSTGLGSPMQDYYITRNRMLFASKFLSLRVRFALVREALRNIKVPAKQLALRDFLLGKFGKGDI